MLPYLREGYGNADSIHSLGLQTREAVESARECVARLIGAESPSQIIFTSGATEGCNWALRSFGESAVRSPFEHSAIRELADQLQVPLLQNEGSTLLADSDHEWQFVMHTNNETGMILTPPHTPARVFGDITQSVGKIPIDLDRYELAALSAHKFYGPKGVGCIYVRDPGILEPLFYGGGHEFGLRSGTLNVSGIVGMGLAAELAISESGGHLVKIEELRESLIACLNGTFQINDQPNQSPYIVSLTCPGVQGETFVVEADLAGFAISARAACSSRDTEPSPVLLALGLSPSEAKCTIRISFSPDNTFESVKSLGDTLLRIARQHS